MPNTEHSREIRRASYKKNPDKVKIRVKQRKLATVQWFNALKSTLACEVCNENHPATLDFHHREPAEKDCEISVAVRKGWSIKRLEGEIQKCSILCSNCHRKLHVTLGR